MSRKNISPGKYCMVGFFNYAGDARIKGYAKWLSKRGDNVDIISAHSFQRNAVSIEDGVRVFKIATRYSRNNKFSYLLEYAISYLKILALLTKQFFHQRYQVIHFHNIPDFVVFTGFFPKLFGAKLILDIHDPMPEAYQSKFPEKKPGKEIRLIKLEEKLSCWFSDAVITANQHFKNNLINRGIPASKITVIKNYPDLDIFNKTKRTDRILQNQDDFVLIFPGTIAPRYGLHVAVKAMPLIQSKIPNVRLQIIGKLGEYSDNLVKLARELKVADHVEIIPSVPNENIPDFLQKADLGIYPALPDPHMSIAIPGKILEFAIMGLPIVSSRLQIVEEMFDDDAVSFFEPGNYEEFARRVVDIQSDPLTRTRMILKTDRILEEKFSSIQETQEYFRLLEDLLNR